MEKFTEAFESCSYKEKKELDAEAEKKIKKKIDAIVGPKGFKDSPDDNSCRRIYRSWIYFKGVEGRSFGGLIGTVGGAAVRIT